MPMVSPALEKAKQYENEHEYFREYSHTCKYTWDYFRMYSQINKNVCQMYEFWRCFSGLYNLRTNELITVDES